MATRIRRQTSKKKISRFKRKSRIRGTIEGTPERPRLSLFRSNAGIYIQVVDDVKGVTLLAASTKDEELKGKSNNLATAKQLGQLIAKRALAKNISKVVFDRSGYLYHGRVKAIADSAREAGLKF